MLKRLCLSLRFVISFGCHSIKMGGGGEGGGVKELLLNPLRVVGLCFNMNLLHGNIK